MPDFVFTGPYPVHAELTPGGVVVLVAPGAVRHFDGDPPGPCWGPVGAGAADPVATPDPGVVVGAPGAPDPTGNTEHVPEETQ